MEQGVQAPCWAPQSRGSVPEDEPPKRLTSKTSGAYIQESQRAVGKRGSTLGKLTYKLTMSPSAAARA